MTKLNFAIIGCGRIAWRHAEHIAGIGNLIAVCDIELIKAQSIAEKYNAKPYTGIRDLLKSHPELDIVSICTPNGLHAEHSILALNLGFHVLCEKPMALKVSDCNEMILAAEKNNKKLFIVKQNRFNPPVVALKQALEQSRLGQLYSMQLNCFWNRDAEYYANSWKGTRELDGGTLFTQFSHFIDLMYWMFGDVRSVHAYTGNYKHQGIIDFEDTGVVIFRFVNGMIGSINFTVNSFKRNMEGSLTVFGEKGTVKVGGEYLNTIEYQEMEGFEFKNLPVGNMANDYGKYKGSMSNHHLVYQNIYDVLFNNDAITTSAYDGLKTVEIIQKIYGAV